MFKLGAQLYTLREYAKTAEDLALTLEKVAKIGYKAVQVSGIGPIEPRLVAKACKDNGLTVAGTHMGWGDFCNKTDEVIEKHLLWECKHSAIGALPGEYYVGGLDGMKKFLDELAVVAPKLIAAGLDFSFHNHNHEFIKYDGVTWLESLYAKSAPAILKAEIDTYWIQAGGGNPAKWIRKYPNRQPLLHLKDMAMWFDGSNREQRFAPIGEGNLDWDDILAAAAESNCRWYLVEQDNCYGRCPFDCLESSYKFLKSKGLE